VLPQCQEGDYNSEAAHMKRRKYRTRQNPSTLVRLVAIGALILWVGLLVILVLNYQQPADTTYASNVKASESNTEPPVASSRPSERSLKRQNGNSEIKSTSVRDRSGLPAGSADLNDAAARIEHQRQRPALASTATTLRTEVSNNHADTQPDSARVKTSARTPADTARDRVIRAQFTTGIKGQEPINRIRSVFSKDGEVFSLDGRPIRALYYFTEIKGMRGETVTHRWEHNGEVVTKTSFYVGGDPWRVYSHEDLPPSMAGDWRLVVTDAQGKVIKTDSFLYQAF
jgi:hypothetical protein